MAGSDPSPGIGDPERAEAQRALQVHLGAGRLRVEEFVARYARAADAVTAAELAALFTDLPAPRPTLPEPPRDRPRSNLLVVGAVAVLLLGALVGVVIGTSRPSLAPVPVAAPPAPATVTETPDALPPGATVRRSTGPGLITLRPSDGVDLDDVTDPAWHVGAGCCGRDVGFPVDAGRLAVDGGHAPVHGPLEFATCFRATGYTAAPLGREILQPGQAFCVRTDAHRLALVTIVEATEQAVVFGATVWDPPIPS